MNRPNLNTKPEQKLHANNDKSVSSMLWTWCYQFLLLCAGAPATWRTQLSMSLARRVLSRNSPAAIATVDRWDRRTDARPLDPAPHTIYSRSVSNIILLQWHSHTSGVRGVRPPPCQEITEFFGMWFLSVIGLRVKPSKCANIFVN